MLRTKLLRCRRTDADRDCLVRLRSGVRMEQKMAATFARRKLAP